MPRDIVNQFAEAMEEQLLANDHKGGWKGDRVEWLLARLTEEVGELAGAVVRRARAQRMDDGAHPGVVSLMHSEKICREAADVANFAMMIVDVCGGLPSTSQNEEVGGTDG